MKVGSKVKLQHSKITCLDLDDYISMNLLFSTLVKGAINQWYKKVK